MQKNIILIFIYSFFLFNCNNVIEEQQALILKNEPKIPKGISQPMYFPPNENNEWETISLDSLDWNQRAIEPLTYLLKQNKTKSFIILVDGKIVMEEYYDGYNPSSAIDWQSAYKSVIGSIAGIAQQEGLFSINDKVSDYLGNNWSKAPIEKEKQIKISHLLAMNSGLDAKYNYIFDAGKNWYYDVSVFFNINNIIKKQSNTKSFDLYFQEKLLDKIGMSHFIDYTFSTTRDMARFGLFALNKGKWKSEQILNEQFFNESISSSQKINPAYGYLWWLNGKCKFTVPINFKNINNIKHITLPGHMVFNAPKDMFMAIGGNHEVIIDVVPSKKMVVIRVGEPVNNLLFHNFLWYKLNKLMR